MNSPNRQRQQDRRFKPSILPLRISKQAKLYLKRNDWIKARFEGKRSILDLISDAAPPMVEQMARAALEAGDPVLLDGEEVDPTTVALAFFIDHPKTEYKPR